MVGFHAEGFRCWSSYSPLVVQKQVAAQTNHEHGVESLEHSLVGVGYDESSEKARRKRRKDKGQR